MGKETALVAACHTRWDDYVHWTGMDLHGKGCTLF